MMQEHEANEEAALVAFWQAAPGGAGDVESGVATPRQACHARLSLTQSPSCAFASIPPAVSKGHHPTALRCGLQWQTPRQTCLARSHLRTVPYIPEIPLTALLCSHRCPFVRVCGIVTHCRHFQTWWRRAGSSLLTNSTFTIDRSRLARLTSELDRSLPPQHPGVQVFAALAAEGFQLTAARVPLSRERIPEAADLDMLLAQHEPPPQGDESHSRNDPVASTPLACCSAAAQECMPAAPDLLGTLLAQHAPPPEGDPPLIALMSVACTVFCAGNLTKLIGARAS